MKKIILFLLIILSSFLMNGCTENNPTMTDDPVEGPTYPYFTTDKKVYKKGEKINVKLYNASGCNRVVLTEYGKEPSVKYSLNFRKINDSSEVSFTTNKLESVGDFTLWLCKDNQFDYIFTQSIHIDDDDSNDYGITSASIKANKVGNLSSYSIEVETSNLKKLTYRMYWCKDGVRLDDYMALKTIESEGKNKFEVLLPDNLIAPDEANQIEISVVEGVSKSYFIDNDKIAKKPNSQYLYTFNAISDLHVQSLRDSILFNAHLKTTLTDIYNSNSKAIIAVGDVVNFGKKDEYDFFNSVFNSIENKNNIEFKPALGNHETMYFKDFSEPLGYFKNSFNLDSHYYSFNINNNKFIVLGTDSVSLYGIMNNTQIEWLKNELSLIDKNDNVFIFIHQPFKDTVDGTLNTKYNQTSYGFIQNNDTLRNIFKEYPNAFIFTGHSHQTLEGLNPVLYGNGTDATFINCGSNAYLNQYIGEQDLEDVGGSEGLYIEVYEDYVLVRGREFSYGKWVANCQILLPLNK